MRLSVRLLVALFVLAIVAPGAMAAGETVEATDTFFLRGTGCGATTDLYLDDRSGEDEYDGCGTIGGLPVNEALGSGSTLTTRGTDPIVVDAARELVVTIRTESWVGDGAPGAGQSVVEVSLSGTEVGGGFIPVQLGSASSTVTVLAADHALHVMTIDIPDAAQGKNLKDVSLDISWRGANVNVNNLGMSGDSFIDVPTLEAVDS